MSKNLQNIKCQCSKQRRRSILDFLTADKELKYLYHKPNECNCKTDLKLYKRGTLKLWLCKYCCFPDDIEITTN